MKRINSKSNRDVGERPENRRSYRYGGTVLEAGRSRRQFLKLAGSAAALGVGMATFPLGAANLLAKTDDWVVQQGFPASGNFLSPVHPVGQSFNAVGSYWEVNSGDANKLDLQVRASDDGKTFTDWAECHSDTFEGKAIAEQTRFFGRLQGLTGKYVQFQLNIPAGLALKLVGLTFIDSTGGPVPPQASRALLPVVKPNKPYIISRADWGANEGLRFSGGSEIWPKEYRQPKVMIVHHSETSNTFNADPSVDVRGIYYYHAVTKGWGDIGYNFLIDWKGNIYEGRAGGSDVVGGHAYQYNYGSIGVCLVGSFKTVSPPAAMIDSLVRLLSWKASTEGINPTARLFFIDKFVDCISGHRDVIDTTCPGDAGYRILPSLRDKVASQVGNNPDPDRYGVDLKSVTFSPAGLKKGDLLKVEAVIMNTGNVNLETQNPAPGYTYEEGQTFETLGFDKVSGRFRLAVDFTDNTGVSHPYRWGLGEPLPPGETRTITGFVRMNTLRKVDFFGGVIQEYVKYFEDNVGTTRITTIEEGPNRTTPAEPRSSDPNIIYFNETGHNLGYAFRRYWEQNGGLAIFGYPLTEEFEEASPTEIGKTFVVQYFQRNRFEYHPEFKGTRAEVLLGLLGVQLTQGRFFFPSKPITNTADKVYFKETKHTLGGAFYRYWRTHGGLPIFGFPISEEFEERNPDDGKTYTVQYFERNRFEYHPEYKNTPSEVLLGLLGTELCRRKGWL